MALRFGYTLMRVRPEDDATDYQTLLVEEFGVDTDDELRERKAGLRDWAKAKLTEMRPELALFCAVYSTIDEGDTGWPFGTEHLVWDGTREIALSR